MRSIPVPIVAGIIISIGFRLRIPAAGGVIFGAPDPSAVRVYFPPSQAGATAIGRFAIRKLWGYVEGDYEAKQRGRFKAANEGGC